MRRVFSLFAEGVSLEKLAALLNEEGHAAPHDGGRANKSGRGWGRTTIRAMPCNERHYGSHHVESVEMARFGCTAHSWRSSTICANALSVSERRASRTLVDALRAKLTRRELVERFVSVFRQHTAARLSEDARADISPERLRDCKRRIANLTEGLWLV